MSDAYILVGQTPVRVPLLEWAAWNELADPRVGLTRVAAGLVEVSTVFLGLDHNFVRLIRREAPPLLFETAICGLAGIEVHGRCSTWAQAEEMHRSIVARLTVWPVVRIVQRAIRELWCDYWYAARRDFLA